MKILRTPEKLVLQLNRQEKLLWLELLKLYPCVPSAHHRLSKSGKLPERDANQQLLDEALSEQRAKNKKQIEELQADARRWAPTKSGLRLSLVRADLEWLLQVLNDIRVGSWVLLGSPENLAPSLNEDMFHHFWAMELCGFFQSKLLEALDGWP